ncbi:hypothetical protein R1flu_013004 [Riccia fluitans]|uniref:Ycf20-like protein n=1 Tax=Riccia fluitans TaxID=41844 RepID=A0ABD1ZC90_9MARC
MPNTIASWTGVAAEEGCEMGSMSFSRTVQPVTSNPKFWNGCAGVTSIKRRGIWLGSSPLRPLRNLIILRREKKARNLVIRSSLNTTASPGSGEGDSEGGGASSFAFGTRWLGRIIGASQRELSSKFKNARRKFPLKIFLLLLGYYSANALATILGQIGDWDVLAAGVLVAFIEGVGYLMYRAPALLGERGKELIVYVNFWKSGFLFGLFVDAFKLGS